MSGEAVPFRKSPSGTTERAYSPGVPRQPQDVWPPLHPGCFAQGRHACRSEIDSASDGGNGLVPGPWKPSPYSMLKAASEPKVCKHLLQRDFSPPGLNRVWTSDITYIWTRSGWCYLAIVLDLFSRKVIGWSVSDKPDTNLVIAALSQALVTRIYVRGQLMFHSDQGCQYTSGELCGFLRERGILQSMSRRGQCWDNAPTESFFRTLKRKRESQNPICLDTRKWKSFSLIGLKPGTIGCEGIHLSATAARPNMKQGGRNPSGSEVQLHLTWAIRGASRFSCVHVTVPCTLATSLDSEQHPRVAIAGLRHRLRRQTIACCI